jgi:hypothetical protein
MIIIKDLAKNYSEDKIFSLRRNYEKVLLVFSDIYFVASFFFAMQCY